MLIHGDFFKHYGQDVRMQVIGDGIEDFYDFRDFLRDSGIEYEYLPVEDNVISYVNAEGKHKYAYTTRPYVFTFEEIPIDFKFEEIYRDFRRQDAGDPPLPIPTKKDMVLHEAYDIAYREIPRKVLGMKDEFEIFFSLWKEKMPKDEFKKYVNSVAARLDYADIKWE